MQRISPTSILLAVSLLTASCVIATEPPKKARPQSKNWPLIKPATASSLKQEIAARKGKVVLVNFWATWCPGCVDEFPYLVKLRNRYGQKGLSVLFVSADDLAEQKEKVEPFLAEHRAQAPTWIIQGNQFEFIPAFDPNIKGAFALPRTYLYNRQGQLVRVFSGDKSYQGFEKLIKPLLK
ncbi:MAG: TlpA family protein disulfide reductase [Armatimonadota bacterium]|nr:TlpA family protein disulfide reductase [Armatimonadota bacterium]